MHKRTQAIYPKLNGVIVGFSLSAYSCPECGYQASDSEVYLSRGIPVCPKCNVQLFPYAKEIFSGSIVASGLAGGTLDTVKDTVSILDSIGIEEQKALGIEDLAPQFKELASEVSTLKGRLDELAVSVAERKEFTGLKEERKSLFIPDEVLKKLPTEVTKTIELVRLCFSRGIPQACPPYIRKALESAIYIRLKRDGKEAALYDNDENPFGLSKKIELARQKGYLSRSLARACHKTKLFGDIALHDIKVDLEEGDVIPDFQILRLVLEHMYGRKS